MFLPTEPGSPTDFDFFIGEWDVKHQRLRARLAGSTEWEHFNDTFEGKPVVVRFRWSVPAPDSPRWEQAFSPDGGETWETNWIMEFTRRPRRNT